MKARYSVPLVAAALAASAIAQTPNLAPRVRSAAAAPRAAAPPAPVAPLALRPCSGVRVDPPIALALGKSRLIRLDFPAARLVVGGQASSRVGRPAPIPERAGPAGIAPARQQASDGVADTEITLLSPTELYFLGKKTGSMNVVLQSADGRCVVKDIIVTVDPDTLQAKLGELMPEESGVKVRGADDALVLTGSVSNAVRVDQILSLAASYSDPKKVVNLLRVTAPQQVMLEVKIAEVSKTLLDRFGLDFSRLVTSANGMTSSIVSGVIGGAPAVLGRFHPNLAGGAIAGSATGSVGSGAATGTLSSTAKGATLLGVDAQKKDGIIRVLAEPNIMAISGQTASFLSGGKIFIPVPQSNGTGGGTVITLEEKPFGVGLKFTPTVLDGSRINLKLISEVSELSQTGTPFATVEGVTSVLPSMTTRSVDTTVQLNDGQSFVVAGLIRNNANEALNKFPGLGEVPVMGALFRSTEFQTDQTELMFVVTPRLVKPLTTAVTLPTDNHVVPNSTDLIWMGTGEGKGPAPVRPAAVNTPVAPPQQAAAPPVEPRPIASPALAPAGAPAAAPAAAAPAPAPAAAIEPAPTVASAPAAPAAVAAPIEPTQAAPAAAVEGAEPPPAPAAVVEATPVASSEPVRETAIEVAPIPAAVGLP